MTTTRSSVLRVVRTLQDAPVASENTAIITTTEPELFRHYFAQQLDRTVFVFDNGDQALAQLAKSRPDFFFADFRALDDKWTGQRFLKFVRSNADLNAVRFHLMAKSWFDHQEQWVIKCGAVGFVSRDPGILAKFIVPLGDKHADAIEPPELDVIDEVFGRFAGPMRQIIIDDTRTKYRDGAIEPSTESYIAELSVQLSVPERRAHFLSAVAVSSAKKKLM